MTLHYDLILGQRNVEPLCFLVDSIANGVFRLGGISLERGLRLDVIFELVIFVVNRNQFGSEIDSRHDNKNAKNEFDRTHCALPVSVARLDAISAQTVKP